MAARLRRGWKPNISGTIARVSCGEPMRIVVCRGSAGEGTDAGGVEAARVMAAA